MKPTSPQAPSHAHGHGEHGPGMPQRFEDAAHWSKRFDDPARDAWQKPDDVVAALRLAPDDVVADLGAGTGYFVVRLARAVPQGRVLGIDIEPDMVRFLVERARKEGLPNVDGVLASRDDPKLPVEVDVVLVVNTYHHIQDRTAYFARVRERLAEGGRLAVVDFTMTSEHGPPKEHRIDVPQLVQELGAAGFVVVEQHTFLPSQYFVVFARRP